MTHHQFRSRGSGSFATFHSGDSGERPIVRPLAKARHRHDVLKDAARERLQKIITAAAMYDRLSENELAVRIGISPSYLRELREIRENKQVPDWLSDALPEDLGIIWLVDKARRLSRESRSRLIRELEASLADDVTPLSRRAAS